MNKSIIIEQINGTEKNNIVFDGIESLQVKHFRGARWLRVFYHSAAAGPFPTNDKVMLSLESGRFSVLKYINDMFMYKGMYEMMIECPAVDNLEAGFVWWRQLKFPRVEDPVETIDKEVEGFWLNPDSTWTKSITGNKFTGLARSNSGLTLFDCTSTSTNWYWSIGLVKNERLPCYAYGSEITLWVRVPLEKPIVRDETKISISLIIGFLIT